MLNKCPFCKGEIMVREYYCSNCDVTIRGEFDIEKTNSLMSVDPEIMEFIKVFIYAEGNMKKVEGILNCSYPKVKSLLSQAKEDLGIELEKNNEESVKKNEILDKLDKGKISFEEAMKLLNE